MQSKLGVIMGVVAIVLVIVAMFAPWWVVDTSGHFGAFTATSHVEYDMFGRTETSQSNISSATNTTAYSSLPQSGSVFSLATILSVLGLILGVGMIVIGALGGTNPSLRRFAAMAGILAFVILLVASLYVMSALPAAVNQDSSLSPSNAFSGYWGTRSASGFGGFISGTTTWAAGWGWYLPLVAAILFLIGAIIVLAARRPLMPAPQTVPAPP